MYKNAVLINMVVIIYTDWHIAADTFTMSFTILSVVGWSLNIIYFESMFL